jgi:hypothetical protein
VFSSLKASAPAGIPGRGQKGEVVDDLRAVGFAGLPHRPSFLCNHQEIVPCFDNVYWPAR